MDYLLWQTLDLFNQNTATTSSASTILWSNVIGKPTQYDPTHHHHLATDITESRLNMAYMPTGGLWSLTESLQVINRDVHIQQNLIISGGMTLMGPIFSASIQQLNILDPVIMVNVDLTGSAGQTTGYSGVHRAQRKRDARNIKIYFYKKQEKYT